MGEPREEAMAEAAYLSLMGIGLVVLALVYDVRSKLIQVLEKLESRSPAGK
jgi:hypothetical protein